MNMICVIFDEVCQHLKNLHDSANYYFSNDCVIKLQLKEMHSKFKTNQRNLRLQSPRSSLT